MEAPPRASPPPRPRSGGGDGGNDVNADTGSPAPSDQGMGAAGGGGGGGQPSSGAGGAAGGSAQQQTASSSGGGGSGTQQQTASSSGGGGGSGTQQQAASGGGAQDVEAPRVYPPMVYGIVEPGIYRSNVPSEINFEFLQGLGLRNALYMSPELPTRALRTFFEATGVELLHLGLETWRPQDDGSNPMSVELMKEALEFSLDATHHPLLLLCSSGLHHTGVLVGCLRRLQSWNLTSTLQEYSSFAGKYKSRQSDKQFIETFDLDLVSLPMELPPWYDEQQQAIKADEGEIRRLTAEGALSAPSLVRAGEPVAYRRYLYSAQAATLTTSEHYAKNKMGA